jgi:hypothetical protein
MAMTGNAGMPDFESEFFGLPEYNVNFTRTEDAGDGFIRVYHWRRLGKMMEPTHTVLVRATELVKITDEIEKFATEVEGQRGHPKPVN